MKVPESINGEIVDGASKIYKGHRAFSGPVPVITIIAIFPILLFGCQNWHIIPDDLKPVRISHQINEDAQIELDPNTITFPTGKKKGEAFGVQDQTAFVEHLREELERNRVFKNVYFDIEPKTEYKIIVTFKKTRAYGRVSGVYNLDAELKIYRKDSLSLQKFHSITTDKSLGSFFTRGTVRAAKKDAANMLLELLAADIEEWAGL